ncbi:MAG: hypothetical protein H0W68_03595 [Gemmatimonadaceae bacterium]|nr:hypothetical protein [Gemmatimonadaceae bacterium]
MPTPDDDATRLAVLIISHDPLASALLGAAVEIAGHAPHFPQDGERVRVSLLRVRPRLVLVDCEHDEACSESFVGPSLMTGARILLFRSSRSRVPVKDFVSRLGLRTVELPSDSAFLMQQIRDSLAH